MHAMYPYNPNQHGFNPMQMGMQQPNGQDFQAQHPFLRRLMQMGQPQTGYDSSGINPGGMYTGGNHPAMPASFPQMSGNDPAHAMGFPQFGGYPSQPFGGTSYGPSMSESEGFIGRRHTGTHKFNGFG